MGRSLRLGRRLHGQVGYPLQPGRRLHGHVAYPLQPRRSLHGHVGTVPAVARIFMARWGIRCRRRRVCMVQAARPIPQSLVPGRVHRLLERSLYSSWFLSVGLEEHSGTLGLPERVTHGLWPPSC